MNRIAVMLALIVVAAPGCSGVTNGSLPAPHGATSSGKVRGTLTIRVPRHRRHAHYISPNTQSMSLDIAPASGCTGCSAEIKNAYGLAPGTNAIAFALEPGSYVATIATYDGPLSGGAPSGKLLSESQSFPIAISKGVANVPTITLDGVPYGPLTLYSLTQKTLDVEANPGSAGTSILYAAIPGASTIFEAYAQDFDGNLILGPGAPPLTVSASGGFKASVSAATGKITLVAPAAATTALSTLSISSNSPACAAAGATCSWNEQVGFNSVLAVADPTNSDVMIESTHTDAASPVLLTIPTTGQLGEVAFDKNGNLYIVEGGSVMVYAPPYNGSPTATIPGLGTPSQIAISHDSFWLAVLDSSTGSVNAIPLPYNSRNDYEPVTGPATAIAFDAKDDGLWVGQPASGGRTEVAQYAPEGSATFGATTAVITTGVNTADAVASDSAGDLIIQNADASLVYYEGPLNPCCGPTYTMTGTPSNAIVVDSTSEQFTECSLSGGVYSNYTFSALRSTILPATTYDAFGAHCSEAYDWRETLWVSVGAGNEVATMGGGTFQKAGVPAWIAAYPPG